MKEETYDDLFEEKEGNTNWQAMLFKYVIRWPWFIASVVLCMVCAWLYLKTITPVYNISASIIIKDDKKEGTPVATSALSRTSVSYHPPKTSTTKSKFSAASRSSRM